MILLTGATGFLGSKILKALIAQKYELICIKRSNSNMSRVMDYTELCIWIENDLETIEKAFQNYNIEVIIHCATSYGRNDDNSLEVYDSNLTFPLKLVIFAEKYGSKAFFNTSTFFVKQMQGKWDKVYMDAYTKSKYILQQILKDNASNSRLIILNLQLEHIYGTDGGNGKFVDYLLENLYNNVESISLTEGIQKRDWTYVEDVVNAYIILLEQLEQFDRGKFYHFEIGTGIETSLREFVLLTKKITKSSTYLDFGKKQMNNNELICSCADNTEICKLGWNPQYDIKTGITEMLIERYNFYKLEKNRDGLF